MPCKEGPIAYGIATIEDHSAMALLNINNVIYRCFFPLVKSSLIIYAQKFVNKFVFFSATEINSKSYRINGALSINLLRLYKVIEFIVVACGKCVNS